jgi:hypothetical protein
MSAQNRSRAFEQGRVKSLLRMKQPMILQLPEKPPPRNPVAKALSVRNTGAGRHIRSQGSQRRADRIALGRLADQVMLARTRKIDDEEFGS